MSNRRKKPDEPVDVMTPLLAVLDNEYTRAVQAKNIDRMARIADIVAKLKELISPAPTETATVPPELPPAPRPAVVPPKPVLPVLGHPGAPQGPSTPRASMQDILASAEDAIRREQLRYELALMALNQNVDAMQSMQSEAVSLGLTVEQLARQIVNEREAARLSGDHTA